jgi:hypothetical protein
MAAPAPPQPAFTALFDNASKDPFDGTYGPLFAPINISLTDANPTLTMFVNRLLPQAINACPLPLSYSSIDCFVSTAFTSGATKLLVHPPSPL